MLQTDRVYSELIFWSLNIKICPICGNDLLQSPEMRNKFCGKCAFVAVYLESPDRRLRRYRRVKAYGGLNPW